MQTAAVIDLDSFRARRAAPQPPPARLPGRAAAAAPVAFAPFWIVWVPAWPVR